MKKFLASSFLLLLITFNSFAQDIDYRRPSSLGISFFLNDYTSAQRIRSSSLSAVLRDKGLAKFKEMAPGLAISYFRGLKNHLDFSSTLAGSYVEVALPNSPNNGERFLLEGDASLNIKLLTDKYFFTPYLSAGVGLSLYDENFGAFIPLGGGVKFNFFNEAALFISSQYRIPVTTDKSNYHFMNSIGIAGIIGAKKEPEVKAVEIP